MESEQGADEELCIIPDTERVISQEEKDAASALITNTEIQPAESTTQNDIDEKFIISHCTDDAIHSCIQCLLPRKTRYISTLNERTLYICDDTCLVAFKDDHPGKVITNRVGDLRVKNLLAESSSPAPAELGVFVRKCAECLRKVTIDDTSLSWETMDFCNELCLCKYKFYVNDAYWINN